MNSTSRSAISAAAPGSNGYWRRDILFRPATYTWVAKKAGKIKIQAIGSASGASGNHSGASAGFGERTLTVAVGDTLTIVIPAGGSGTVGSVLSQSGANLSISGTPVGGTPLTIAGALGVNQNGPVLGTGGVPAGPWDKSYQGSVSSGANKGSPSSASPFGPGIPSLGKAGSGWGGPGGISGGGSTHRQGGSSAAPGLSAKGGSFGGYPRDLDGEVRPFWDLADVDSGAGAGGTSGTNGGIGGPGAGGGAAATGTAGGTSALGGGTAYSEIEPVAIKSGFGAGGGPGNTGISGIGGDGIVFIFWDEVQ
jgi:hypothetical protein